MKRCGKCKQELPTSSFWKNRRRRDGLQDYCKPCLALTQCAIRYGLSVDEVEELRSVPVCQGCGSKFQKTSSQHIDHCHCTGRVRGVLCPNCNFILRGTWAESLRRVFGVLNYLWRAREQQRECSRAS